MASLPPIEAGQRFRDVQQRTFGRPGLEWVVQDCVTLTDGVAHARLVCVSDPSRRKTLSLAALGERSRYQRIET
jgi:hypothetical protein